MVSWCQPTFTWSVNTSLLLHGQSTQAYVYMVSQHKPTFTWSVITSLLLHGQSVLTYILLHGQSMLAYFYMVSLRLHLHGQSALTFTWSVFDHFYLICQYLFYVGSLWLVHVTVIIVSQWLLLVLHGLSVLAYFYTVGQYLQRYS